jgi:hypothetical protein
MYLIERTLLFLAIATLTACGPLQSRVYQSPKTIAQQAAREEMNRRAKLYLFEYQEDTKDCRNAVDKIGYNPGQVGPCAFIADIAQLEEYGDLEGVDLRGAVLYGIALKSGTSFADAKLDHSQWFNVTGKKINFTHASMVGTKFRSSSITDMNEKPVKQSGK